MAMERQAGKQRLAICLASAMALALTSTIAPPRASAETTTAASNCANSDAIGVSRTVQIDTTGGPGFGLEHYKAFDFLQPKEVVLTFDDGPQKYSTEAVLAALAAQCTKATFFSIGKMALGYPEIIREVVKAGHTVGTHTWSHQNLRKSKTPKDAEAEIERGVSAVRRAVGGPVAPFFRFPTLQDSPDAIAHLNSRNIAMFSTDIDSFDFKIQSPENIVKTIMAGLEKKGKGIVLMHDIHKKTAAAVPLLLKQLKAKDYKIVHLTAKDEVTTLTEYDEAIEKDAKGLPQAGTERPTASVVRTIEGTPTPDEQSSATVAVPVSAEPTAAASPTPSPLAPPAATIAATPVTSLPAPAAVPPSTTASITPPSAAPVPAGEPPAQGKSLSQRAGEMWDLWFGK